ncbi:hypothetical protein EOD23_34830 [Mesorhizobium sp. USDA-HM6]|nr:hypothetical protein EOD23_34830 [Mesorhizobium sp. USDA-HM6]
MFPIRLEWQRPADGVDLVNDEKFAKKHLGGDGRAIRARSERTIPVTYEVTDLESPVVVHFMNCRDDKDRQAFVARFGFLQQDDGWLGFMPWMEHLQERMTIGLIHGASARSQANDWMNEIAKRVSLKPSFQISSEGRALRLVMHPDSLVSFMVMEIAMAHEAGAVATTCEHCGKYFLTGPLTGRRSHAKYCSDRCRVAAMRKRNSSNGE